MQKGWLCQSEVGGETLVLLSVLAVLPWTPGGRIGGALSIWSYQHRISSEQHFFDPGRTDRVSITVELSGSCHRNKSGIPKGRIIRFILSGI